MTRSPSTTTRRDLIRAAWLLGSGTVLGALAAPTIFSGGPSALAVQDDADPTATREAELDELHGLQTEVAEPKVCTPAATATPVPATATATVVPAAATGQQVGYGERWLVTILGVGPVPSGDVPTQGQLLRVNLTIVNRSNDVGLPPFNEWLLTDATGQSYSVSISASGEIPGGGWGVALQPGESAERAIVYDVPTTVGTTFLLESRKEPDFRVALAIESRG